MMTEIGLNSSDEPISSQEEVKEINFQKFCDIMGLDQNSINVPHFR